MDTPALSSPVWIQLPNLPLLFLDLKNIGRIATMVGEPLWMVGVTIAVGHLEYALICVKINPMEPLQEGVWVHSKHKHFF